MIRLTFILLLVFSYSISFAQDGYDVKKVLIEEGFYDSGELEYYSKTTRKGIDKSTGRIYGKQIIKLKEFYKNGQKELKEKKVLPRIVEEQHLVEDRHILQQKQKARKYKMWDKDGNLIEKGKINHRGRKRIIKYNYKGYKKTIITFDREVGRDVIEKKKPIYK